VRHARFPDSIVAPVRGRGGDDVSDDADDVFYEADDVFYEADAMRGTNSSIT